MTAQEYLQEHGITETTIKKFNLVFDDNYLHIPVKDEQGKDAFTKSRNLNYPNNKEPKYKNSAGSHATLFNAHAVEDSPNIVLCEGEIDCMRLTQAGIPSVSSTGGASTLLPEWSKYFENKNVWICLDNDKAGNEGTHKALELIPHARVIQLSEDSKDICEFMEEYSKKDFVQLMRIASTKLEWESQNFPEEYSLDTAQEIAGMEFPEENWLIKDILYSEGFAFLYGGEGTGKSFIALDIAKAVATGNDWLGKFTVANSANVLVLDKENPKSMVARRLKGLGMENITNIHYLRYPEKFSLSNGKGELSPFAQALSTIVQRHNIKLIIVDSFVDLMVGNESSSEDTQGFFNALRVLFPNLAFLVLHHENKPSQGLFRSDSQRLRGSSNINAQTFTMFRLEQVAKSKTEMTLKQTKARDSMRLDKFMIKMKITPLFEGGTAVAGFEYMGIVEDSIDETKSSEAKDTIKEMINSKKFINHRDLLEVLLGKGISDTTGRRTIKEMLDEGEIVKQKRGREVWYGTGIFDRTDALEELNGEVF